MGGPSRRGFANTSAWLASRSTTRVDQSIWLTTFGVADASEFAPYQIWRGAGANQTADAYLRAHPLLRQGSVIGDMFGRGLGFGTIEYNRPFWRSPAGPVQWAAFVDGARAWNRAGSLPTTRILLDVGVGLRLRPPAIEGVVRFDVAYGARDGRVRASVSLMPGWPRR